LGVIFSTTVFGQTRSDAGVDSMRTHNYALYRHFWLNPSHESDTFLARVVINDNAKFESDNRENWLLFHETKSISGYDKYVDSDSIELVNLSESDDQMVVGQFLLSLELYNLWFKFERRRGAIDSLSISDFFTGDSEKVFFSTKWSEDGEDYGVVSVSGLQSIRQYNFGHVVHAECIDDNCTIYFPPYSAKLHCSLYFYENMLYPKYLNYISKEHRRTSYQLQIIKVDLSPQIRD
jgi:hypothetical protein